MPLEVDELPESLIVPITPKFRNSVILPPEPVPVPVTLRAVTPVVMTPITLSPPIVVSTPVRPLTPPTPVYLDPDNVYASKYEALSQVSALNRRSEPVPEELSRTSALNTRYTLAAEINRDARAYVAPPPPVVMRPSSYIRPPPPQPQPKIVSQPPRQSRQVPHRDALTKRGKIALGGDADNMDFFMDSVFHGIDDDVSDLNDPFSMEGKIKGGGDNLQQTQVRLLIASSE